MNKTPLFLSHQSLQARFVSFADWKMPFSYSSPREEHLNTRRAGGLFDVSHMGQIRIQGRDSLSFLQKLLPTHIGNLSEGQCCYSVFCDENGGLIDDLIIYALKPKTEYLLCVNAAKKEEDKSWLESQVSKEELVILDESPQWGMIAVQGPKSLLLCEQIFPHLSLSQLKRFHFVWEKDILISQTGYTGEQGLELYIPWDKTLGIWEQLLEKGASFSVFPVGLGARDTLRLEMAYLLSGQDFDNCRTPVEAGLSWLMTYGGAYVGKEQIKKEVKQRICGFFLKGDASIPRKGQKILSKEGDVVGFVTSGAKSPSLEKMIGLAYIDKQTDECFLNIREELFPIQKVFGPFFKK